MSGNNIKILRTLDWEFCKGICSLSLTVLGHRSGIFHFAFKNMKKNWTFFEMKKLKYALIKYATFWIKGYVIVLTSKTGRNVFEKP